MTKPKIKAKAKAELAPLEVHGPLSLYERLHLRAYDVNLPKLSTTVRDRDLDEVYRLLMMMREALQMCSRQFHHYSDQHKAQLDSHLSLVERQNLDNDIARNLGIARSLDELLKNTPELPAAAWRDIATAPRDGSLVRALGKRESGETYIETTRWWNIQWAIQLMHGYRAPTHWLPLERLPEDYK